MLIPFEETLYEATFVERPNRFILFATLADGEIVRAHVPDPGRLEGLLVQNATVFLRFSQNPNRKTRWTAVLVERRDKGFVSLEAARANDIAARVIEKGIASSLSAWTIQKKEYTYGHSRWDFLLHSHRGSALLEVKSVTLAKEGIGYFPDAVTKRGRKHVEGLSDIARSEDGRAILLFVAQREDIHEIRPAEHIDPEFAEALKYAKTSGVMMLGIKVKPSIGGYDYLGEVPVRLFDDLP
ncbi:DNA/RNA nuclease SfsA [Geomicrobium sp. JCM 19039]|uniref:DNA/RNA nuclease SfsA n=1 Tax=Geomicrobium sp. JCM 19039 TaxID=1460636 RepID=UPI00045F164F|nr:DNA/RNA nuclease SfsA [Geomicrobium sp. JCM 19039]GAK12750.1 sugar/maltose fermentation stimulation protein homolog [Geomicrobium sp. JCM 19039]